MLPNEWGWRQGQEEACRFFDFTGFTVIDDKWTRRKYTDSVKRIVNEIYGAKALENKEDTNMNIAQDVRDEQAKNNVRYRIMKKLKFGDKICTSFNLTTSDRTDESYFSRRM